jgi:hypothetical protein
MVPSVISMEMLYKANNHRGQLVYDIWGTQKRGEKWQLLNTMPSNHTGQLIYGTWDTQKRGQHDIYPVQCHFSLVKLDTFTK